MTLVTKIIVSAALLLGVSASSAEIVCVTGSSVILYSFNRYQVSPCLTIPLSSAQNQWGGGKSSCNAGTFEEYWNISDVGETWLCYGSTSKCTPALATKSPTFASTFGYDKCWYVME